MIRAFPKVKRMRASRLTVVSVCACALGLVSCGGESAAPAPAPTPSPAAVSLVGSVSEAAPFSATLAGAKVEVVDGSNAGKSAVTDAQGKYSITGLNAGGFTVRATAADHAELALGVTLASGPRTQDFRLAALKPHTEFAGGGLFRVNVEIVPGRYFGEVRAGGFCSVARMSGPNDVITEYYPTFDADQWIVDVLPSDYAVSTGLDCGHWSTKVSAVGQSSSIRPGVWLVGTQVSPGRYTATAQAGCHWERLRDFAMVPSSIIATADFQTGETVTIEIKHSDVGFHTDLQCGTWTRVEN
jgi:hypothetical protein